MLKIIEEFSEYIGANLGINKVYINLTILTILVILFFDILKFIIR